MAYTALLQVPNIALNIPASDNSYFDSGILTGGDGTILIAITGAPTGGTFTLTYGAATTSALSFNATAAQVQAALVALTSIGAGGVQVFGQAGGAWIVQFIGSKANTVVTAMTHTDSLTGGTSPAVVITAGSPGSATLISTLTELLITFNPTFAGAAAPYANVYVVDQNNSLALAAILNQINPMTSLGIGAGKAFGASIEVKVFASVSTPPCTFNLSIVGK